MDIVDLSTDVAGRFAARLFVLAGARVQRPRGEDRDPLSLYLDSGKTDLAFDDLGTALAGADLVFTSWDSGDFCAWAKDRDRIAPGSVEVTTSSFGMAGPYAAWRGGPLADWAAGGYLAITGEPGREPLIGPERLCAYVAGYAAAAGAEAALRARRRDGRGRHVDISTMDVMLGMHQSTFSRAAAGFVRERTGRYGDVYPLTVLPCASGFVSLGIVSDEEFDRLAIAFGLPHLAADPRFAGRAGRMRNSDALDAELATYLMAHNAGEIVAVLQAGGVAAMEVVDPRQILENPQLRFRHFWTSPEGEGKAVMPGNPIPASKHFPAGPRRNRATLAARARDTAGLPLEGVTILDLTAFWAGPSATRFLADLGADVIWLERPGSRLDFDEKVADPQALMHQLYHEKMNRHKRSIVLDLETAAGQDAAWRLAAAADVVIENFRPGVAARLGMGPADLCASFPDLVYVSLSGFGSEGPWGDWRSFGPNIEAASSILARTGYPGEPPMRLGHALPDGVGGLAGALAVLRGLRERDERGAGGWFDISQLEVYTALSGEDILDAAMTGRDFPRIGNRSRSGAVQGVFRCLGEDEWIAIRLDGPADIARFTAATGLTAVQEATSTFDKHTFANRLQQAGLEAFPVLKPNEYADDPHALSRNTFVSVERGGRTCALPASPLHSEPPLTNSHGAAPRFGEHNAEIMRDLQ